MENQNIKWSTIAIKQFNDAIDYIASDSQQKAERVHDIMLEKIEKTAEYPYSCPVDKYKLNNNGQYRYFTVFH